MTYAFVDVIVDGTVRCRRRAVAEVSAPTPQNLIESIPHFRPRLHVVWYQEVSHFLLDTRYALLRRTRTHIPTALPFEAVRAEAITEKVKSFLARLLDASLRLIQGKTQPRDYLSRPIQCLRGLAATQDHEIICIGDHMSLEFQSPFGVLPTLQ